MSPANRHSKKNARTMRPTHSIPLTRLAAGVAFALAAFGAAAQTAPLPGCFKDGGRFDRDPQETLLTPGNCVLPDGRPVSITRESAQVKRLRIEIDRDGIPADGQTPVKFTVRLFGPNDQPLDVPVTITVEHSGGRVQLMNRGTDELGPARGDMDRLTPGVQIRVQKGVAEFMLLAPSDPQDVTVRVTAGAAEVKGKVSFLPELREMLATGFIEGIISRHESGDTGRSSDGFEREISKFSYSSDNGKTSAAARSAFFLKGVVKGEYLLTAAYDSDKAQRSRLFRDIRPEEFYPIYGDSSIKGFDARTAQKLYVRIDKNKSFLLFGDYTTGSTFDGQALGNYQRSLTGVKHHYEDATFVVNTFGARDTVRQMIDEMPARGVSGPYVVSNLSGIRNSEKVEILTRDRNQPSIILSVTPMTRFEDYTFEPFSGQVVFKAPVPTVDMNFNPNTVRITYEVDQGGDEFTVAGVDGRVNLGGGLSVGGSYIEDHNPADKYSLRSANAAWQIAEKTRAIVEVAKSERGDIQSGNASRVELRHLGGGLEARVAYGQSDTGFFNQGATLQSGRREGVAKATYALNERTKVYGEALLSEDRATEAKREAAQAGVQYKLSDIWTVDLGVRTTHDKNGPVNAGAAGISNIPLGTGFTPYQLNAPSLNPAPQLTNTTTYRGRLIAQVTEKSKVWGEAESDFDGANRYALGADYQLQERTRLYARYENLKSNSGGYGLNDNGKAQAFTAGVDTQYMKDGTLFSEMRMRDAFGAQEASAATGVRNLWTYSQGVRFMTGAERLQSVKGDKREASAVSFGFELTYDTDWKASGRVEYRQDNQTEAWLSTLAYTAKVTRDWSFIARNYLITQSGRVDGVADRFQDRVQVGMAWRPVDSNVWNALGRYELKKEKDGTSGIELDRLAHIFSTHVGFHPSRPIWVNGRLAAKTVDETVVGVNSKYQAYMVGGRAIYDINERWDVGVLAGMLYSPQGASKQWASGLEGGYLVASNLWISAGYNWMGFKDRDLTGSDYTQRGVYMRLRWKFDEDLLGGRDGKVNRTIGE